MKACSGAGYLLFGMALAVDPIVAVAQIVTDPAAGTQGPAVGLTRNGISQIDITAPSAAGVSSNRYLQFDVPQAGVIVNNSPEIVQTRQAGMITGNPNLEPGQSARIIVNEVGGESPSLLQGYLEVAGAPAEVVVANENGIVADGAGFINTTRAILATGAPVFGPDGMLDRFDVRQGVLAVRGAGLNTSNVDQLDLIARAVSADAMVHGNTLNVVAGSNRVDHATLTPTSISSGPQASEVRIDVGALGGLYASRIVLVATEAGIGVSSRGVLAAQEGDLRLTSEGRLILEGRTHASGNLTLASEDGIDNRGATSGAHAVSVETAGDIYNGGLIDAQGELKLAARNLVSTGIVSQVGSSPMTITVGSVFDNSNGTLQTGSADTHLTSTTLVNDYGRISHAGTGSLRISSDDVSNRGGTIASGGVLDIHATDLRNASGTLAAQRQVDVDAQRVDNSENGYIGADNVVLSARNMLDNRGGRVEAGQQLEVDGDEVLNQAGSLDAGQHARIAVRSLDNSGKGHIGADRIALTVREGFDNRDATLEANGELAVTAGHVVNDAGLIRNAGTGALSIVAQGSVSNRWHGLIGGNGAVGIASEAFDNTGGRLVSETGSGAGITLATHALANDYGLIESDRDVAVRTTSMQGGGSIVAANDLDLRIASDYTRDLRTRLHANHDLTLTVLGNFSNRGQLGAVNALTVHAANVDNPVGASLNATSTTVDATGAIHNAGRLEGDTVATRSASLRNIATILGGTVTLNADTIDNAGASAVIAGAHEVNLHARELVSNTDQASVFSLGDLHIAASGERDANGAANPGAGRGHLARRTKRVVNERSTLEARGDLGIAADTLVNIRPAPVVETVTVGVDTKRQGKRDKYMACATGNAVAASTCSQAVWNAGYKAPRHASYEASRILSVAKGPNPVDRLLVVRTEGGSQATDSIYYETMTEQRDGSITVSYWDGYDPHRHYDPATEYPTRSDGHKGYQRIEMSRETTTTTREDRILHAEPAAQVIAGGNIMLANVGVVDNHHGAIAAGKSIWIGSDRHDGQVNSGIASGPGGATVVSNTGQTLYRHQMQDIVSRYAWNKQITRDVGFVVQAPVVLPPVAIGGTGGTIIANEAVGIQARDVHNTRVAATDSTSEWLGSTVGTSSGILPGGHPGRGEGGDANPRDTGSMADGGGGRWQSVIAANGELDLKLPTSGVYDIRVAPEHPYLIVTDPRLTSYSEFISSDYMLEQLGLDPQATQKRLGDGLVEQQEVRRQITALTGRAHLPGYASAEDEYRALMASGAHAARQFALQPGIALTGAQMDALTSDIVWLVSQPVKLHDGSTTQVLAPVVYLTLARAGDLRPGGAVVAADDIELHAIGDVTNSGVIAGKTRTIVTATDVLNLAGTIGSPDTPDDHHSNGRDRSRTTDRAARGSHRNRRSSDKGMRSGTVVAAARDVINESGRISGPRVAVLAGRDIVSTTRMETPIEAFLRQVSPDVQLARDLARGTSARVSAIERRIGSAGPPGAVPGSRVVAAVPGAHGTVASSSDLLVLAGRDLSVHGAHIVGGGDIRLAAGRDIIVDSVISTITQSLAGNDRHHWEAQSTSHQTSLVSARRDLEMQGGNDVSFRGATIEAGRDLDVRAGDDLVAAAVFNETRFDNVAADDEARQEISHTHDRQAVGTVLAAGRNAKLAAGRADPGGSGGSEGDTSGTDETAGTITLMGSSIVAGTNGSTDTDTNRVMPGTVSLVADGDIVVGSAGEAHSLDMSVSSRRGSLVSRTREADHVERTTTFAIGSTISGDAVDIQAGRDLKVKGSSVAGTNHVAMKAQRNIDIAAGQETVQGTRWHELRRSGIWETGGLGFAIGTRRQRDTVGERAVFESASRSTVGSVQGNVSIMAGGNLHVGGSDIVAGRAADDVAEATGHIEIHAKNLALDPARDMAEGLARRDMRQYGATLAFGGAVGNAFEAVDQSLGRSKRNDDPRLAALDKARAAISTHRAAQAVRPMVGNVGSTAAVASKSPVVFKATGSIGAGRGHDESRVAGTTSHGSTLSAAGRVSLIAAGEAGVTGAASVADAAGGADAADEVGAARVAGTTGEAGTAGVAGVSEVADTAGDSGVTTHRMGDGDIRAEGVRIMADDVSLFAARDITLQSAQDVAQHIRRNGSRHLRIGVGAAMGGAQTGFTFELGAGGSQGYSNSHRVTHRDTEIVALDALSMRSGRDTKLLGAQGSARTIEMNIGRDLTIASRQDTNRFRSAQTSAGIEASLCMPPFCHGQTVSGSAQASVQALRNDFASVNRQSGIYAGEGGYTVEVDGHTRLNGGVMASTAEAGRNALSTGTFDYSNIQNVGRYAGSMLGLQASGRVGRSTVEGVSFAEPPQKMGALVGLPGSSALGPTGFGVTGTNADTAEMTYAAVSPGTIDVRGDTGGTRDSIAGLSRDPSHANGTVQDTFNARAVSDDLAVQRRSGQLGMQAVGELGTVLAGRAGVWGDDGIARIASHAAIAALGATIGHGSALGAAGGTFAGDIAGHSATEAARDWPGRNVLANLAAGAAGAATGALLGQSSGGQASGITSGAHGALSADLYNRQLHSSETVKLVALKRGRSADAQQRLIDAACALTRCAAGVAANDPHRQRLLDSQSRGSRYTAEQDEIRAMGAFDGYGVLEALNDWVDRRQISSRAVGAVHGLTGAAGAASVFRTGCSTIALCGMAATAAATQLNYSKAGLRQFIYGEPAPTYGERTLRSLGLNETEREPSAD